MSDLNLGDLTQFQYSSKGQTKLIITFLIMMLSILAHESVLFIVPSTEFSQPKMYVCENLLIFFHLCFLQIDFIRSISHGVFILSIVIAEVHDFIFISVKAFLPEVKLV